jgi:hypothetical protein
MEMFAEALSVIGALLLSVGCGLLMEELVFGGLSRLFFARRPKTGTEKDTKGERQWLR